MYYLINEQTGFYAREDSVGEHDDKVTTVLVNAASFEEYGEASEYSQNFGPDWRVDDSFA